MKEDLQIEIAARLADSKAPEDISGKRADDFVRKTLGKEKKTIPFYVWYGAAVAVAASVMFVFPLFRMNENSEGGTVHQLMEKQSVHSDISQVDSTLVDSLETVVVINEIVD